MSLGVVVGVVIGKADRRNRKPQLDTNDTDTENKNRYLTQLRNRYGLPNPNRYRNKRVSSIEYRSALICVFPIPETNTMRVPPKAQSVTFEVQPDL